MVVAAVDGFGLSADERLRTLLYRTRFRYVNVNGDGLNRVVPSTIGDGVLVDAGRGAVYPGGQFALSPQARTLRFTGTDGPLRITFRRLSVRP